MVTALYHQSASWDITTYPTGHIEVASHGVGATGTCTLQAGQSLPAIAGCISFVPLLANWL